MPFPLAHPAAVLPLRRYCPQLLSFAALVIGSVCPDAGYLLGRWNAENFSHSFVGSLAFSLPLGVALSYVLFGIRLRAVEFLPGRMRGPFLAICRQPIANPLVIATSVLIGAWTHLLLDSVTHQHGWCVERVAILHAPIGMIRDHTLRVCHVLWYGSSFAGVAWLSFDYEKWRQVAEPSEEPVSAKWHLFKALMVGMLTLPIEAVHHALPGLIGMCVVGALSLALVLAVALGLGDRIRAAGNGK